jgi:hypothetical protein
LVILLPVTVTLTWTTPYRVVIACPVNDRVEALPPVLLGLELGPALELLGGALSGAPALGNADVPVVTAEWDLKLNKATRPAIVAVTANNTRRMTHLF